MIEIETDINQVVTDMGRFRNNQFPFAMMNTINELGLGVQKLWREGSIPNAWTTRNNALPRALTTIPKGSFATKRSLVLEIVSAKSRVSGFLAGEGFFDRQVSGDEKTPKGRAIAIPVEGRGLRRGRAGAIPKAKRAKNRNDLIKVSAGRGKDLLLERVRKDKKNKSGLEVRYILRKSAQGTSPLSNIYRDAHQFIDEQANTVFFKHMSHAIKTSRFE